MSTYTQQLAKRIREQNEIRDIYKERAKEAQTSYDTAVNTLKSGGDVYSLDDSARVMYRNIQSELAKQQRDEQERLKKEREQMSGIERFGHTLGDFFGQGVGGVMKFGENFVDYFGTMFGADEDWIKRDWTQELYMDKLREGTKGSFLNDGKFGNMVQSSMFGLGNMLPSVAVSFVPYVGGALSLGSHIVNAAGGSTENALQNGATRDKALLYGTLSGISEGAIEKISGGIGGVGKGIVQSVGKSAGKSAVAKGVLGTAKKYTGRMIGEGLEEVASDVIDPLLRATYTGKVDYSDVSAGSLAETFGVGAMTSGLMLGGQAMAHNATAANRVRTKLGELNEVKATLDKRYYDGKLTEAQYKQGLSDINWLAEKTIKTMNRVSDRKAEKIVDKVGEKRLENAGIIQDAGKFSVNSANVGAYNYKAMTPSLVNKVDSLAYQPTSAELTAEQESLVKDYGKINNSKASIVFTDDIGAVTEDGSKVSANGAYSDGVIYISRTAENPLREVMKHEFTHALEGTKAYGKFASFVIGEIQKSPVLQKKYGDFAKTFIETAEQYKGVTAGDRAVVSEIVAKYSERLFSDPKAINRLARANKGLAMKVLGMVTDRLSALGKSKGTAEMRKFLRRAERLYRKAITAKPSRVIALNGNTANEKENATNIDENSNAKNTANIADTTENNTNIETNPQNIDKNSNITDGNAMSIRTVFDSSGKKVQFSIGKPFAEQIDDIIKGIHDPNLDIYVSQTPDVLINIGFKDKAVLMRNSKVKEILEKHKEMSLDIIKNVPNAIENPLVILKSKTNPNDSVVIITEINTEKGNLIIPVWMNVEGKYYDIELNKVLEGEYNFIASAYGRNIKTLLEYATNNNEILYFDKSQIKKVNQLFSAHGLQLPAPLNMTNFDNSISNSETNVNNSATESLKNDEKNANIDENSNKDIKFSLKKPIEYKKNLIAIHNLSESKLLDSLSLGGFAMPSIAVLKADGDHNSFGDISVVFRPSAVDPKANTENKIYSADAYTPRFPQTEYSYNRQAMRDLADKLNTSVSMLEANEFKSSNLDDIYRKLERNNEVKKAFIEEKGLKVVPVLHDPEFSRSLFNNDAIKEFLASGITFNELVYNESIRNKLLDLILNKSEYRSFNQKWVDKINDELNDAKNDKSVYEALEITYSKDIALAQNKAEKVETPYSYREGLSNLIEEHSEEYSAFVKALVDPVIDKKWLRNNKEFYTPSGNPRSFEQLHEEYTADNAVRLMKELGLKNTEGGVFGYGLGELKAALSKTYDSIEAVHKDEARLKKIVDDELSVLYEKCEFKLIEICDKIAELINHDNIYIANQIASNAVLDIVRTKTDAQAKAVIKRDYSFELSDEILSDVRELAKDIAQLPVEYFEAKPVRVVNFNEIAAIVAPSTVSSEVKNAVDRLGIQMVSYDKNNLSSRVKAVNSIKDIKFSLKANKAKLSEDIMLTAEQMESVDKALKAIENEDMARSHIANAIKSLRIDIDGKTYRVVYNDKYYDVSIDMLTKALEGVKNNSLVDLNTLAKHIIFAVELYDESAYKLLKGHSKTELNKISKLLSHAKRNKIRLSGSLISANNTQIVNEYCSVDGAVTLTSLVNQLKEMGVTIKGRTLLNKLQNLDKLYETVSNSKNGLKLADIAPKKVSVQQRVIANRIIKSIDKTGAMTAIIDSVKNVEKAKAKAVEESVKADAKMAKAKEIEKQSYEREKMEAPIIQIKDICARFKEYADRNYRTESILAMPDMDGIIKAFNKITWVRGLRSNKSIHEALTLLQSFIKANRNAEDVVLGFSGEIVDKIDELVEVTRLKPYDAKPDKIQTKREVDDLLKVVKAVDYLFKHHHAIVLDGEVSDVAESTETAIKELDYACNFNKGINAISMKESRITSDPRTIYTMVSGAFDDNNVIMRLYDDLLKSETEAKLTAIELLEPVEQFFKDNKRYKKDIYNKKITVHGVSLELGQAIMIYMQSKQVGVIDRLTITGAYGTDSRGKTVDIKSITASDIETIEKQLSKADFELIKLFEDTFSRAGQVKYEADNNLNGYSDITPGKYYVPLVVEGANLVKSFTSASQWVDEFNERNYGFNQHRNRMATKQLKLVNVFDEVYRHCQDLGVYAKLTQAFRNFDQLMNYNINLGNPNSKEVITLKSHIKKNVWSGFDKYQLDFFADIRGDKRQNQSAVIQWLRNNWIVAKLGLNIKSWVSQFSGLAMGVIHLDFKHLAKGTVTPMSKERFLEYGGYAKVRVHERAAIRAKGFEGKLGRINSWTTKPIQMADNLMMRQFMSGCESQIEEQLGHKVTTREEMDLVCDLFETTVRETQSGDMISEKSALQRHSSDVLRTLATFKSDAIKMISNIKKNIYRIIAAKKFLKANPNSERGKIALKEAKKRLRRSVTGMTVSNAIYVGIALLFNLLLRKRDEEGKKWVAEDYGKAFGMGMLESFVGMYPLIGDIFNKATSGYDIEQFSYSMINDLVDGSVGVFQLIEKRIKGEEVTKTDGMKAFRNAFYAASEFFGVPSKNLFKYSKMIVGRFDEGAIYKHNSLFYPAKKSELNAAIEEKNDRLAESIFGVMLTERGYGDMSETAQKKLLELYKAVYKDGDSVLPSNVPNKVTWKDANDAEQEKELKATDKAVYRANNAKAAKDIEKLLKSGEFSSLSKKEQADAVKKVYTYYNALSKAKVTENQEINTQMLLASLLSVEDMAILSVKNASLVADKYANGKIILDSKKRKLLKLLNSFGLTFAEKELVRVILGYSPSNPKTIKQTIRHSSLNSEEKAHLLGKI